MLSCLTFQCKFDFSYLCLEASTLHKAFYAGHGLSSSVSLDSRLDQYLSVKELKPQEIESLTEHMNHIKIPAKWGQVPHGRNWVYS